jgi:hypothetical protein
MEYWVSLAMDIHQSRKPKAKIIQKSSQFQRRYARKNDQNKLAFIIKINAKTKDDSNSSQVLLDPSSDQTEVAKNETGKPDQNSPPNDNNNSD